MISGSKVCFFFENKKFSLRNRSKLKRFIQSIFKRQNIGLESLNYIFTSDIQLLKINKQYLGHDYLTDVISFDLSDFDKITGEIYISIDRVRDNANQLKTSFTKELHRIMFHGALHLCGFNDKSKTGIKEMRKAEDLLLSKYLK